MISIIDLSEKLFFSLSYKKKIVRLWNGITRKVKEIRKVYLNCPYGQFVFSSYYYFFYYFSSPFQLLITEKVKQIFEIWKKFQKGCACMGVFICTNFRYCCNLRFYSKNNEKICVNGSSRMAECMNMKFLLYDP